MAERENKVQNYDSDYDEDAEEMRQLDKPLKRKKAAGNGNQTAGRRKAADGRNTAGRQGAASAQTGAGRNRADEGRKRQEASKNRAVSERKQTGSAGSNANGRRAQTAAGRYQAENAGRRAVTDPDEGKTNGRNENRRRPTQGRNAGTAEAVNSGLAAGGKKEDSIADDIVIILVSLLCILMILSYCGICGQFGVGVNVVVFGLFGRLGYVLPVFIFIMTVFFMANKENTLQVSKIIYSLLFLCVMAGLIQLIAGGFDESLKLADYFTGSRIDIEQAEPVYGGFLGGLLTVLLCPYVGRTAAIIIFIALLLILFVLGTGKAFITYLSRKINRKAHSIYENKRLERQERRYYRDSADYDDEFYDDEADGTEKKDSGREGKRRRMGTIEVVTGKKENGEADNADDENQEFENPGHLNEVTRSDYMQTEAAEPEEDPSIGFLDRLKNRNSRRDGREEVKDSPVTGKKAGIQEKTSDEALSEVKLDPVHEDNQDESGGNDDFSSEELNRKFGNRPSVDIISLRNNPNPVKPTTRMYIKTDEDNNIVRMPISKRLHAGSSNLEDSSEAVSYRIHGLDPQEKDTKPIEDIREDGSIQDTDAADSADNGESFNFDDEELFPEIDDSSSKIVAFRECNHAGQDSEDRNEDDYGTEGRDAEDHNIVKLFSEADNQDENEQSSDKSGAVNPILEMRARENTDALENGQTFRDSSGAVRFTDMNAGSAAEKAAVNPEFSEYRLPPVSLLAKSKGHSSGNKETEQELENTINLLQETFESFGVGVTVTDASIGPTVTRYEVLPNKGVKVKNITQLSDDLKLALAAPEIRIEAPIPGKAAVGIEVPNKKSEPVLFGDMIDSEVFRKSKSKISFAVGKDISGESIVSDIGSMPHALIAGATGSGKSVCINALIMSILYKAKPTEVKMIMVDPKRVELVGYNGIPHLLVPVVTDVKKAGGALNWALAEMDNRYQLFADNAVTNLASYNKYVEEKYHAEGNNGECPDRLPQILIIIDELNDLMMTSNSKEVENAICRLTQLARACGIHVILATQRPSVNVLTGTIKANIPTRIAFSVSSHVDSRTILDQQGAEKLLGKGDMLFYPAGYVKPVRVQGVYVSDDEVKSVVSFIKEQCRDYKYNEMISRHIDSASETKGSGPSASAADEQGPVGNGRDEYFNEAGRFIIEKQKASIGSIQRVYSVGFNRAARIMDQLAAAGVVGSDEGTKARKILMTAQEFEDMISSENNDGQ